MNKMNKIYEMNRSKRKTSKSVVNLDYFVDAVISVSVLRSVRRMLSALKISDDAKRLSFAPVFASVCAFLRVNLDE